MYQISSVMMCFLNRRIVYIVTLLDYKLLKALVSLLHGGNYYTQYWCVSSFHRILVLKKELGGVRLSFQVMVASDQVRPTIANQQTVQTGV